MSFCEIKDEIFADPRFHKKIGLEHGFVYFPLLAHIQSAILTFQSGYDESRPDLPFSFQGALARPSKCKFGRNSKYILKIHETRGQTKGIGK